MSKSRAYALQFLSTLLLSAFISLPAFGAEVDKLQKFLAPSTQPPLPAAQYVPVEARRLAKARVLWVNWDYFRSIGIDLGRTLTPEVEKALIETFAWGIPNGSEPRGTFESEARTLRADYYGGSGRGGNLGSGRAASLLGEIPAQLKGLGRTPLTTRPLGGDHANGGITITEALREAIFGEVNHRSLPHGSNRVMVVFDRGTSTEYPYGILPDALVVRQDPIRPAHFIVLDTDVLSTPSGRKQSLEALERALPIPPSSRNKKLGDRITDGVYEFIRRLAQQQASAFYGAKLAHGALNQSNMEINGRFLDYGTETANIGHAGAVVLEHVEPAGETHQLKNLLVKDFLNELRTRFPEIDPDLPPARELVAHFEIMYTDQRNLEFLKLLGIPEDIAQRIQHNPESLAMGELMDSITRGATQRFSARKAPEKSPIPFDAGEVLMEFYRLRHASLNELAHALQEVVGKTATPKQVERLSQTLLTIQALSEQWAQKLGLGIDGLNQIQFQLLEERNRTTPELYRWSLMEKGIQLVEKYQREQNPKLISDFIDSTIDRSVRRNERQILRSTGPCRLLFVPAS